MLQPAMSAPCILRNTNLPSAQMYQTHRVFIELYLLEKRKPNASQGVCIICLKLATDVTFPPSHRRFLVSSIGVVDYID